jgi:N-acetylglutamate synthase-like GNAT family acetyltransferase
MSTQTYLRWADRSDIPAMAEILVLTGVNFEFHDQFAPKRSEHLNEYYLFLLCRIRTLWAMPGFRFLVVESLEVPDATKVTRKQVIGMAGWMLDQADGLVDEPTRGSGWFQSLERTLVATERYYHQLCINTIFDTTGFASLLNRLHEAELVGQPQIHLQILFVHPEWQKSSHRVGHRLLQWGIDLSDRLQLPIAVTSSLAGQKFYAKHGFEFLTFVRVDRIPELAYDQPILLKRPEPRPNVQP